jgi:hypothetical protein
MPSDAPSGRAAGAFAALSSALGGATRDSLVRQFDGCVVFDLGDAGKWTLDLRVSSGAAAGVKKGVDADAAPDLTVSMTEDVFIQLINGEVEPASALMGGAQRPAARAAWNARRAQMLSRAVCACVRGPLRRLAEGARQHVAGDEAGAGPLRRGRGARKGEAVKAARRCRQRATTCEGLRVTGDAAAAEGTAPHPRADRARVRTPRLYGE